MSERPSSSNMEKRVGGNVPTTANVGLPEVDSSDILSGLLPHRQEPQTGTASPCPETSLALVPVNQPVLMNTSSGVENPAEPVQNQCQQIEGNFSVAIPNQSALIFPISHPKLADKGTAPIPESTLNATEDVGKLNELILQTEIIPNLTLKNNLLLNSLKEEMISNANLELEIQKLSKTVDGLGVQLDKKKAEELLLTGEISGREIVLEHLRTEAPDLKEELARMKEKKEKASEKLQELELTLQIKEDTIRRLQRQHTPLTTVRRFWKKKVDARVAQVARLTVSNNELQQGIPVLRTRIENLDRIISSLEAELERQKKEKEVWDEEEKIYEEEIDEWQKRVAFLKASLGMETRNATPMDEGEESVKLEEGGNQEDVITFSSAMTENLEEMETQDEKDNRSDEPDVGSNSVEDSSGNEESGVTAWGTEMEDGDLNRKNFAADMETA